MPGGDEIPRLRFAPFGMTCGGDSGRGWGRDRVLGRGLSWWDGSRGRGFFAMGGRQWREGEEGVREGVIRMKDGFSPPVLKGAGYSRE